MKLKHWVAVENAGNAALVVAPHALGDHKLARHCVVEPDDPFWKSWFDEWNEASAADMAVAIARGLGGLALVPRLPRSIMDMGRLWSPPPEAEESLAGKAAVDTKTLGRLTEPGLEWLRAAHHQALEEIRSLAGATSVYIEAHNYGIGGSTYDASSGRRASRRPEFSVVNETAPWTTGEPTGVSRFIPGDLRPASYHVRAAAEIAASRVGLVPGPSPYVSKPWSMAARVAADRWFMWLALAGELDQQTAEVLRDLVWSNPFASPDVIQVDRLAARVASLDENLARRFQAATQQMCLVLELRIDLGRYAGGLGGAVAAALGRTVLH